MLHMIGNSHLDPVWLWRWTDGCAEAIATCWSAIDRLDESPGFIFTRGEAQLYAWIEEYEPNLFARIREFVADGRWIVVNGWWVQPDCNLPSGEAIIRQALYGKRYFAERFGITVSVGYNVDSFGHAATLPMLLRHTGSDSYVFMRPGAHEMELPADLFDWVSPDGSRVTAFRLGVAYHTAARAMPLDQKIDHHLALITQAGHPFMCFYGVGNHGGGVTRESVRLITERRDRGDPIAFSDPVAFFREVTEQQRPEVARELQFHAIGCYAIASDLKALNRRAEARLEQAEAAATLAWRETGADYPHDVFEALWRKLLFNQFHDTLAGTSIESACRDAAQDFNAVLSGANTVLNASARHLARTIRPIADGRDATLLLMNFNFSTFDCIIEAEPWTEFDLTSKWRLLDEAGCEIPFQFIAPEGRRMALQRIAFRLAIPGYGYRLLRFPADAQGARASGVQFGRQLSPDELIFETAGWRLEIDRSSGAIAALINRASGLSVFTGPAHQGRIVEDPTDTWSHGVDRHGLLGEDFVLDAINEIDDGPVRCAIEIVTRAGDSVLASTVLLPDAPDLPVDIRVRIDWREQRKLLRLAYPLAGSRFEYEIPAGWCERPDDGREVFGHRWVRAVRSGVAVVLANDAKYSYAAQDGTLFITAARSPVYAHHDPVVLEPDRMQRYLDQGEQLFTLRIQAAPVLTRRQAMALADGLLKPPVVTPHVSRGGEAPHQGQWLAVETASAAVTALKRAEDGKGAILRAIELDGHADQLHVGESAVEVNQRSIVTARLDGAGLQKSDGLER
jgi:alpha-mannosidase